jgi:hypothetical protein
MWNATLVCLFVVGGSSAVLLGAEKTVWKAFAPGVESHLEIGSNPEGLQIKQSGGKHAGWLRLKLPGWNHGRCPQPTASLDGAALIVRYTSDGWLEIRGTDKIEFDWVSGREITLLHGAKSPPNMAVEDWSVYGKDGQADTMAQANYRSWINILLIGALLLALPPAALGVWRVAREMFGPPKANKPAPGELPHICHESFVAHFQGADEDETKTCRDILQRVLVDGWEKSAVFGSLGELKPSRKRSSWIKARRYYDACYGALQSPMRTCQQRLAR